MKTSILVVLTVLVVSAASSAPTTSLASTSDLERHIITPGVGVPLCSIGMRDDAFIEKFGGTVDGRYRVSPDRGVDAEIVDGVIVTLFFHFYSRTYALFPGETSEGIGAGSSIEDVIEKFGDPEERSESVVSPYGPMPGARDESIRYPTLGISFTFYDGRMANIRVYRRKPNQALQTTSVTRSGFGKVPDSDRQRRGD